MEAFKVVVRVRYAETDRMGHAYYANYFQWFEVGRVEFLRDVGASYKELEDSGTFLPVSETNCKYLESAQYDDELEIITAPVDFGKCSVAFETKVVRMADGQLLAEGRTRLGCVDGTGRPKRLPPQRAGALSGMRSPKGAGRRGGAR